MEEKERKPRNKKLIILIIFLSGVIALSATYAWLSASLNVKVKFFDLKVSSDSGLFISLDGVDFTSDIEISMDSIINEINETYPSNTNQWAAGGLWSVSSNGIPNSNSPKFDVYMGDVRKYKTQERKNERYLNTEILDESIPDATNAYIAFDIFLKNVSGSPKSDNLFLDSGTMIEFGLDADEELKDNMKNIMDSLRIGLVKMESTSSKSEINTIQNLTCNNNCEMIIYELNSKSHSEESIEKATEHGITLEDGVAMPTYAVIKEGTFLEHMNGQEGTEVPLDTEHFKYQKTITGFTNPIFQIPNGITKVRVYVWVEGQDVDSLETYSKGAPLYISIDLEKDLAGYE